MTIYSTLIFRLKLDYAAMQDKHHLTYFKKTLSLNFDNAMYQTIANFI